MEARTEGQSSEQSAAEPSIGGSFVILVMVSMEVSGPKLKGVV